MMADTERPITKIDAAAQLGVSLVTLEKWIRAGRIRKGTAVIDGRSRTVVDAADVRRVKQERETVQWEGGDD